jgi:hypothetical protein
MRGRPSSSGVNLKKPPPKSDDAAVMVELRSLAAGMGPKYAAQW